MTFQELELQLLSLNPTDKVRAIEVLTKSLGSTAKGIAHTPGVCGGDARLDNTRIPVWVLMQAKASGYSDADLLASYPMLSAADLVNAWAYAEAFPDEIEQAIARNEAA
ncbi:MAG: DUF433 domain-containing protein [Cyanobacteria bacterium P01_F01_bin.53]